MGLDFTDLKNKVWFMIYELLKTVPKLDQKSKKFNFVQFFTYDFKNMALLL